MVVVDAAGRPREVRWSARRKAAVVEQLMAGAPVERTASEIGVDVTELLRWRERFVAGGTEALKGQRFRTGCDR
ncbi:MAG: helix-turn-helix domain-containing protein [Pseudonocardiaceae bacterium]